MDLRRTASLGAPNPLSLSARAQGDDTVMRRGPSLVTIDGPDALSEALLDVPMRNDDLISHHVGLMDHQFQDLEARQRLTQSQVDPNERDVKRGGKLKNDLLLNEEEE